MEQGTFIAVEGGEGVGKTTLIGNLAEKLTANGSDVLVTREPGGTAYAEEVREALIRKRTDKAAYPTPRAQLLGFYSARFDHIEKVILPALQRGATVLCDRFELTSYAYQVHAQDQKLLDLFRTLHTDVCTLLDGYTLRYILCDLDPEIGVRRALARDEENTSFDEKNMDFHRMAHEGRHAAMQYISDCFSFHVIDATRSKEEMVTEALAIITE